MGIHGSKRVCKREAWSLGPERHPRMTDASQASEDLSSESKNLDERLRDSPWCL